MRKRKLPTGIQTFRELREEGCYYVDKTAFAHRLVAEGKHYFLSRPRRFGKSLFVDTLKQLFEGREALFRGLAIHDRWDWAVRHPVVRIDFSGGNYLEPDWEAEDLIPQLARVEDAFGVTPAGKSARARLRHLVAELHERTGQRVAILVDEYDKPLLDAIGSRDVAEANRIALRGLYSIVKQSDAHIKFSFFTGVTKFSKVSLFSDVNNLIDLSLDPSHAAICGYTDADLDATFAAELEGLDRQAVRDWYDGYNWLGDHSLYNPWAVLLLFQTRRFKAHWFESSTPGFLIDILLERQVGGPALETSYATEDLLSAFDIDDLGTEALLFQTGYLTIAEAHRSEAGTRYRLGCPNREVRQSLNAILLRAQSPDGAGRDRDRDQLRALLAEDDVDGVAALFRAFFASIPHQWFRRNDIARFEGYYASVFYSHFAGAGLDVTVEESASRGDLDMAVRLPSRTYVFEFKVVASGGDGSAMRQIKARGYAEKYQRPGETVRLIGVEFSQAERNIVRFDVERALSRGARGARPSHEGALSRGARGACPSHEDT